MYTILENARIVLALLKKHNIRHIVLSPGGSNIPIVQGVQQDPFFKCYSVVDERSAMYFAIGLYLQTGEIIATSCTSAQATRNYVPGLTEAYYKHVPILAITMSKHPKYLGQEYMQCPIQTSLPIDCVKKSYSLPYISNVHDRAQCVRTANEAILELTHHNTGPVQLNIEELDNETWVFDDKHSLPDVRAIFRYKFGEKWNLHLESKKILIVIGEHRPFDDDTIQSIESFTESFDCVIYTDHTSNYYGKYSLNANIIVSNMSYAYFMEEIKPDILITIGGLTGDYGIYGKLFAGDSGAFEHWRISPDGDVVDTYGKLTKVFECTEKQFFSAFSVNISEHSYFDKWNTIYQNAKYDIDLPFSNMYVAQQLHKALPSKSILNLAILNSLRTWSCFPIDKSIKTFSNLAAFGIDGCMSTLLGESVNEDNLCFLVTGDLAFFYDMNALGIRHIKNNVRIILVNNNGGAEFKLGTLETRTDVSSYISAADHFKNAKGWAETCGFTYLAANNKDEFLQQKDIFLSRSDKPILFEIFTSPEGEREANRLLAIANSLITIHEEKRTKIKNAAKAIIGEKVSNFFKDYIVYKKR